MSKQRELTRIQVLIDDFLDLNLLFKVSKTTNALWIVNATHSNLKLGLKPWIVLNFCSK